MPEKVMVDLERSNSDLSICYRIISVSSSELKLTKRAIFDHLAFFLIHSNNPVQLCLPTQQAHLASCGTTEMLFQKASLCRHRLFLCTWPDAVCHAEDYLTIPLPLNCVWKSTCVMGPNEFNLFITHLIYYLADESLAGSYSFIVPLYCLSKWCTPLLPYAQPHMYWWFPNAPFLLHLVQLLIYSNPACSIQQFPCMFDFHLKTLTCFGCFITSCFSYFPQGVAPY